MPLAPVDEFYYLGICLAGFFYGLYSGIFVIYLQCHANADKANNIIFYTLCFLYVLAAATIGVDILSFATTTASISIPYDINTVQFTLFACCDFIAQSVLIYRCWIVWGRSIRVVIAPLFLAFAFLATWLASITPKSFVQLDEAVPDWSFPLALTGLTASMTVNALVTGLIVFKIYKVLRKVEPTLDEQALGTTGGRKLYSIILVIIESGMALFSIQVARLVVTVVQTNMAGNAYQIIVCIHEILNGITPTIILVRVSMGLSFHDEASMSEAAESLCFALDHRNSTLETGSITLEMRTNDDNGNGLSDDIQMVER